MMPDLRALCSSSSCVEISIQIKYFLRFSLSNNYANVKYRIASTIILAEN
jgi:hypothetical protein